MTTFLFILVFYHLGAVVGTAEKPPTILFAKTAKEACAMRNGHKDVEVLRMAVLDDGVASPQFYPVTLICEGDERR